MHEAESDPATSREDLRARYALQYGVTAGHLPSSLDGLDEWLSDVIERIDPGLPDRSSVAKIRALISSDRRVRGLVTAMIEQSNGATRLANSSDDRQHTIRNIDELLGALNLILGEAPRPTNAFPVSGLLLYMMYTEAGWLAFRNEAFNRSLREYLREYEAFLNSSDSLSVINAETGWLAPPSQRKMSLKDFVIDWNSPTGGFESYNDFFHRQIKPEVRQLAGEGQRDVIVSANDGVVFRVARHVQLDTKFWTKDQPYSLRHMLTDAWAHHFVDGDVFQTFLAGSDYHRWMAPVAGKIVHAEVRPGLMFSELLSVGWDPGGGTKSTAYEASVNTRGIVIIDSGDAAIGLVAVVPIGITEVSSVLNVDRHGSAIEPGRMVEKGEEIGRFSLGGSTLALVFQPAAIKKFRYAWPPDEPSCPPPVSARDWIALAN